MIDPILDGVPPGCPPLETADDKDAEIERLRKALRRAQHSARHISQLRADTGNGDGSVIHLSAESYTDLAHDLNLAISADLGETT